MAGHWVTSPLLLVFSAGLLLFHGASGVITCELLRPTTRDAGGNYAQLEEGETQLTVLAIISCTLTPAGNTFTCINSQIPRLDPFDVYRLTNENDFKIYYIGGTFTTSTLDYSVTPSYTVRYKCTEAVTDMPATGDLHVQLLPNQPPRFARRNGISDETNARSDDINIGHALYTVSVTDYENDPLTFTMTQDPDSNYLTIGKGDGVIRTNVNLKTVTVPQVICTVSVSDGSTTVQDFVTVRFTNLNSRPVISNLPAVINVTENQLTGFTLITLSFTDDTVEGTLVPECSVDPVAESYKFTYEVGTRKLKLNTINTGETLLDFETTNKYTIECSVSDGYLRSQGDILTMYVNNVNEAPVFSQTLYFCTLPESDAGISTCTLDLTVSDPELNNIPTLELLSGNNSERFHYNRITDKLTFNVNYDVDNSAMPTSALITIYAVDSNRATGTSKIQITIQDVNDNTCNFGAQQGEQFTLHQDSPLTTLGTFAATDGDLTAPNNEVTFELIQGFPSSSLNYLTVFGNGDIKYVGLIPDTEHGKSFSVTVRCKDKGTPSLSATGTVQVSFLTTTTLTTSTSTTTSTTTTTTTPTTTTTTTTTTAAPEMDIWDESAFVIIFAILMVLLGLLLLALLWYFCCRNNPACTDMCAPRYQKQYPPTPRQVRPVRQQQQQPRDDYFRHGSTRVSPDYREQHWRNGDHYEDGLGYDGRPISNSDINVLKGNHHLALPAPVGRNGMY